METGWTGADAAALLAAGVSPARVRDALKLPDIDAYLTQQSTAAPPPVDLRGCWAIPLTDPRYPELLTQISAPPPVLFGTGDMHALRPGIAVVGSRDLDDFGHTVAHLAGTAVAHAGVPLHSGLAIGADVVATQAALDAGGTATAAIPVGADLTHPGRHQALADRLRSGGGAVISEQLPGTGPGPRLAGALFSRNRILVALSRAVVVAAGRAPSGTLNSVWHALAADRPIITAAQRPGTRPRLGAQLPGLLAGDPSLLLAHNPPPAARRALQALVEQQRPAAAIVVKDRTELAAAISRYARP